MGAGDDARLLPHGALEQPDRLLRRRRWRPRAPARTGSARSSEIPPSRAPAGSWERFEATLDDDFNTPDALALLHEWRDHELVRRALDVFGLAALAREDEAPSEVDELARRRQEAREGRDFAEADRLRAAIESAGWDVRDDPDGYRLVPRR